MTLDNDRMVLVLFGIYILTEIHQMFCYALHVYLQIAFSKVAGKLQQTCVQMH